MATTMAAMMVLPFCAPAGPAAANLAWADGPSGRIVREIRDPATGRRWLLERQAPGAPGRLVVADSGAEWRRSRAAAPALSVIRAGDPVLLEQHTPVLDAELEGAALTAAAAGGELRVRLKIGGRTVRAVALARGRAQWLPEAGGAAKGGRP